jgi:hypothetical protein
MNESQEFENCRFCRLGTPYAAQEDDSPLSQLNEKLSREFNKAYSIPGFDLDRQSTGNYLASVMFRTDRDIRRFESKGRRQKLEGAVYAELENAGLGARDRISVRFDYDSRESQKSLKRPMRIPTAEDFARAERKDRERWHNLSLASEAIKERLSKMPPFHDFWILPFRAAKFSAYVFLKNDKDIDACKNSGMVRDMIDIVYDELERVGRGSRSEITVHFEFDSDENVQAQFHGNYWNRLRS